MWVSRWVSAPAVTRVSGAGGGVVMSVLSSVLGELCHARRAVGQDRDELESKLL